MSVAVSVHFPFLVFCEVMFFTSQAETYLLALGANCSTSIAACATILSSGVQCCCVCLKRVMLGLPPLFLFFAGMFPLCWVLSSCCFHLCFLLLRDIGLLNASVRLELIAIAIEERPVKKSKLMLHEKYIKTILFIWMF